MSGNEFDPRVHCSGIFDRLERFDAADRAHLFYAIENRWCWDCGEPQAEGDHAGCGGADLDRSIFLDRPAKRPAQ